MNDLKNKQLKLYSKGFAIGNFIGVVICIIIGKTIYTLPIVLGGLFGAIALKFNKKNNEH